MSWVIKSPRVSSTGLVVLCGDPFTNRMDRKDAKQSSNSELSYMYLLKLASAIKTLLTNLLTLAREFIKCI